MLISNLLLILTSLISFISPIEIQLTNDTPYPLGNLPKNNDYKFIFYGTPDQTIVIQVTRDNPPSIGQDRLDIFVTEYSSKSVELDNISYLLSSGTKTFSTEHLISQEACSYIGFEIIPYNGLTNGYVKATIKKEEEEEKEYEYEIDNNYAKSIDIMSTTNSYKFYIYAYYNNVIFKLKKTSSGGTDNQPVTIYEYHYREATEELIKINTYLNYFSYDNSYRISYTVNKTSCKYVAFKIKPQIDMENVLASTIIKKKIDYEYELTNYTEKNIGDLKKSYNYRFNIDVKFNQTIDIELFCNDLWNTGYYLRIYEYYSRDDIYGIKKDIIDLFFNSSEDSLISLYSVASWDCNFLGIEFAPGYDMENVRFRIVAVTPSDYLYDLTNNINNIYFENLFNRNNYKFQILAKNDIIYDFEFYKKDSYSSKNQKINIFKSYCNDEQYYLHLTETIFLYYQPTENLYINSYTNSESEDNICIIIEIIPRIKMEKVNIVINERTPKNYKFDLKNGTQLDLGNIYTNNNYLFYFPANYENIIQIVFNNMLQSENLTIYEYSEKDFTKKENFSLSNCNVYDNFCIMNYVVNNSLSKYIVFELNSKYNARTVKVIATIMPPVIEYHFLKNGGKYLILSYPYIYKFFVPASYGKTVNFEMDFFLTKDYQAFTVYEYENISSESALLKNELVIPFNEKSGYSYKYGVVNSNCHYVVFYKKLLYDMGQVPVHFRVEPPDTFSYQLTSGVPKYFDFLVEDDRYKFYIVAKYNQTIKFKINKKDKESPSQRVYIFEYINQTSMIELYHDSFYALYNKSLNNLEFSYKVNNSQSNYILIEMKIDDTLTSVDLLVNVIDEKDEESEGNNNGDSNTLESSYIIIIAVTSVVVIGVIALVIFFLLRRKRNKDGLNEIQDSSIQMTQPLQSLG